MLLSISRAIADYLICHTKCWKETAMTILFTDNKKNQNLSIKIYDLRASTNEEVNNFFKRCWNKCFKTPNTVITAFKVKILNGNERKTEKLTALEYFNNKFQEKDQTDDSPSKCNSVAVESNTVKNNIFSESNHNLICNGTMQAIDQRL